MSAAAGAIFGLVPLASPAASLAVVCPAPVVSGTTATVTCQYTGADQTFTVPNGVSSVTVEAEGAQGGGHGGGDGARLVASFAVTGGETLNVLVGGAGEGGETEWGGGGGASAVFTEASMAGLLLAAGGGGGSAAVTDLEIAGSGTEGAGAGEHGGALSGNSAGGTHGDGGQAGEGDGKGGGGGGGFLREGESSSVAEGGFAVAAVAGRARGASEHQRGGFAGGGAGGITGGGGGGGYNGGGGGGANGSNEIGEDGSGGGGGSYSASTASVAESGVRAGNGLVVITYALKATCTANTGTVTLSPGLTNTATVQTLKVKGELTGCTGESFADAMYKATLKTTEEVGCSVLKGAGELASGAASFKWTPKTKPSTTAGTLAMLLTETPSVAFSGELMTGPFSPLALSGTTSTTFTGGATCGTKAVKKGKFTGTTVTFLPT